MKIKTLFTLLAISSQTYAGGDFTPYEPAPVEVAPAASSSTGNFFIGAGYGYAFDTPESIQGLDTTDDALNVDDLYSLEIGYQRNYDPYILTLSLEGLWGTGSDSRSIGGIYQKYETENFGVLANVKLGYEIADALTVYAGAGIGYMRNYLSALESTTSSYVSGNRDEDLLIWQALAGLEFKPTDQLGLYLQYRYLTGEDLQDQDYTAIDDSFVEAGLRFYF